MTTYEEIARAVDLHNAVFCAHPGCGGNRSVRQYCGNCYAALKRKGQHPKDEPRIRCSPAQKWVVGAVSHKGDDCLLWPFYQEGGYGYTSFKRKHVRAHVAVCEGYHGPKPTQKHEASHECGNSLCCNPRHLSWKTHKENIQDKLRHGTLPVGSKHHAAKLDEDDVRQIRSLRGSITRNEMTSKFGVNRSTIDNVLDGRTWRSVI